MTKTNGLQEANKNQKADQGSECFDATLKRACNNINNNSGLQTALSVSNATKYPRGEVSQKELTRIQFIKLFNKLSPQTKEIVLQKAGMSITEIQDFKYSDITDIQQNSIDGSEIVADIWQTMNESKEELLKEIQNKFNSVNQSHSMRLSEN